MSMRRWVWLDLCHAGCMLAPKCTIIIMGGTIAQWQSACCACRTSLASGEGEYPSLRLWSMAASRKPAVGFFTSTLWVRPLAFIAISVPHPCSLQHLQTSWDQFQLMWPGEVHKFHVTQEKVS